MKVRPVFEILILEKALDKIEQSGIVAVRPLSQASRKTAARESASRDSFERKRRFRV
jgi:hypothetical protein